MCICVHMYIFMWCAAAGNLTLVFSVIHIFLKLAYCINNVYLLFKKDCAFGISV